MTPTPELVALIEQIVDARLALMLSRKTATHPKSYHTTPEIRQLITENLTALIEWFGDDEFDIAVLRHCLARKTTMRQGDTEIPNADHQNMTRWDSQVLNAINPAAWPECPIVPTTKRRHYRILPINQLSF